MNISVPEGWREVSKDDFEQVLSHIDWVREAYANGLFYKHKATGDRIGLEMEDDHKFYLPPSFFVADAVIGTKKHAEVHPEIMQGLQAALTGDDDAAIINRLWLEFRFKIQRASLAAEGGAKFTWQDIVNLIDAMSKRARRQLKSPETRVQVLSRFKVMSDRAKEFITHPEKAAEKCGTCHMPIFICRCNPQDPILQE